MSQLEAIKKELEQEKLKVFESIKEEDEKTLEEILELAKNFFNGQLRTELSYSLIESMLRSAFVTGKVAHSAYKIKIEAWEARRRNILASLTK